MKGLIVKVTISNSTLSLSIKELISKSILENINITKFDIDNIPLGFVGFTLTPPVDNEIEIGPQSNCIRPEIPLPTGHSECHTVHSDSSISEYVTSDIVPVEEGERRVLGTSIEIRSFQSLIVLNDNEQISPYRKVGFDSNDKLLSQWSSMAIISPISKSHNLLGTVDVLVIYVRSFTDEQIAKMIHNFSDGLVVLLDVYHGDQEQERPGSFIKNLYTPETIYLDKGYSLRMPGKVGHPIYVSSRTIFAESKDINNCNFYDAKIKALIESSRKKSIHFGKRFFADTLKKTYEKVRPIALLSAKGELTLDVKCGSNRMFQTNGEAVSMTRSFCRLNTIKGAFSHAVHYSIALSNHKMMFKKNSRKLVINDILAALTMTGIKPFGYGDQHHLMIRNSVMGIISGTYINPSDISGSLAALNQFGKSTPREDIMEGIEGGPITDIFSSKKWGQATSRVNRSFRGTYLTYLLEFVSVGVQEDGSCEYSSSRRIVLDYTPKEFFERAYSSAWSSNGLVSRLTLLDEMISLLTGTNKHIGFLEAMIEDFLKYEADSHMGIQTYHHMDGPLSFDIKINPNDRPHIILGKDYSKKFFDELFKIRMMYYSDVNESGMLNYETALERSGSHTKNSSGNVPKKYWVTGNIPMMDKHECIGEAYSLMSKLLGW